MIDINAILGVGEPTVAEAGEPLTETTGVMRGDTCHIDVVDRWGNMVAPTPSGGWLQSSPVVPGLGFSRSTRAQDRKSVVCGKSVCDSVALCVGRIITEKNKIT